MASSIEKMGNFVRTLKGRKLNKFRSSICYLVYSNDPKTGHPNTGFIRKPDFFESGFQMSLNTGQKKDRFSDESGIWVSSFQIITVNMLSSLWQGNLHTGVRCTTTCLVVNLLLAWLLEKQIIEVTFLQNNISKS